MYSKFILSKASMRLIDLAIQHIQHVPTNPTSSTRRTYTLSPK